MLCVCLKAHSRSLAVHTSVNPQPHPDLGHSRSPRRLLAPFLSPPLPLPLPQAPWMCSGSLIIRNRLVQTSFILSPQVQGEGVRVTLGAPDGPRSKASLITSECHSLSSGGQTLPRGTKPSSSDVRSLLYHLEESEISSGPQHMLA